MDQEQLIRTIMAEVMKDLGQQEVSFQAPPSAPTRTEPSSTVVDSSPRVTVKDYPLAEKHPERVRSASGKSMDEISFSAVADGSLQAKDFRITQETLELQAQIAEDAGRAPLARNLRRAAELVPVPDERLLEIYNALRPYRSTKPELIEIAEELETQYQAKVAGAWIREAAEVYERRDRLRID